MFFCSFNWETSNWPTQTLIYSDRVDSPWKNSSNGAGKIENKAPEISLSLKRTVTTYLSRMDWKLIIFIFRPVSDSGFRWVIVFDQLDWMIFFTPIPCSYTSLPLDGVARNYFFFLLYGYARSCNWSCLDPFISYLLCPRRKTIWSWAGIEPRSSCFTSDRSNH